MSPWDFICASKYFLFLTFLNVLSRYILDINQETRITYPPRLPLVKSTYKSIISPWIPELTQTVKRGHFHKHLCFGYTSKLDETSMQVDLQVTQWED